MQNIGTKQVKFDDQPAEAQRIVNGGKEIITKDYQSKFP
jgi:hypothetical protein